MSRLTSEKRREKILQAAVTLFSLAGFNGTTTRQLARKAGVSEALLFRHFPNKKLLYEALLKKQLEERIPQVLGGLPEDAGPEILLKSLARRIARAHEDDPKFLRLFLFSALEDHKLNDLFFKMRTLPTVEFLQGYFRKMMGEGRMRNTDPEAAAFAFMAMVFGYVQTRIIYKIPQVLKYAAEERVETYVDIFLKGLGI